MTDNNPPAIDTLTSLVQQIDWCAPEAKRHRANMRSIAIHLRNHLTKRKPCVDDMALAHMLDKFIDWSTDPTNEAKTAQLREACDIYQAML